MIDHGFYEILFKNLFFYFLFILVIFFFSFFFLFFLFALIGLRDMICTILDKLLYSPAFHRNHHGIEAITANPFLCKLFPLQKRHRQGSSNPNGRILI